MRRESRSAGAFVLASTRLHCEPDGRSGCGSRRRLGRSSDVCSTACAPNLGPGVAGQGRPGGSSRRDAERSGAPLTRLPRPDTPPGWSSTATGVATRPWPLARLAGINGTKQWVALLGAAVAIVATGVVTSAGRASPAAAATSFPTSTAVRLAPAPGLAVPADGRLNGYGFTGTVLGAATAGTVNGLGPAPGQRLWVFGLRWQVAQVNPAASVSVAVTAGDTSTPVPLPGGAATSTDTGPLYWAVSEPDSATDVAVVATSGGVSQTFSLTHLDREGTAGPALYRTPGQWQTTVAVNETVTATVRAFDGLPASGVQIILGQVTLSNFGPPGPNDTPINPADGWLTVGLSSQETSSVVAIQSTVTASQVTLTLPGQPPVPATVIPGGGADSTNPAGGLFPDRYTFAVPADLTTATLTVTATGVTVGNTLATISPKLTPATFALHLPAPVTPTPPAGAATAPIHDTAVGLVANRAPSTAGSPSGHGRSRSDGGLPVGVIVLVVVLVGAGAAAGWVLLRRRRTPTNAAAVGDLQVAWAGIPTPRPEPTGAPTADVTPVVGSRPEPPVEDPVVAPVVVPETSTRPQVRVLGSVSVEGWAEAPERGSTVDLVVYLACHPDRPVGTDRLRAALSDGDTDIAGQTLRSIVSRARRSLPDGCLPSGSGGYRLVDVDCDWTDFQALVRRADTAEPETARALLGEALGLVRGRAMPEPPRWADLENLPSAIDRAVTTAAGRLARLHLDAGDPSAALAAAETGLGITPTDVDCSAVAMEVAAPTGRLPDLWRRVSRAWAEADMAVPDELGQLRRRLSRPT